MAQDFGYRKNTMYLSFYYFSYPAGKLGIRIAKNSNYFTLSWLFTSAVDANWNAALSA